MADLLSGCNTKTNLLFLLTTCQQPALKTTLNTGCNICVWPPVHWSRLQESGCGCVVHFGITVLESWKSNFSADFSQFLKMKTETKDIQIFIPTGNLEWPVKANMRVFGQWEEAKENPQRDVGEHETSTHKRHPTNLWIQTRVLLLMRRFECWPLRHRASIIEQCFDYIFNNDSSDS